MQYIFRSLIVAVLLSAPLAANAVTAGELTKWCSVEESEELSADDQMDQLSCLVFLQGALAGIHTTVAHLEDEY